MLRRFAFALLVSVACGACGNEPPPETPAPSVKPADKTEVKMEAVSVTSAAASAEPAPSNSNAPSTMAPPSADPSDDPNIGGPQEATLEKSIAPIRPRLRACYKKALETTPGLTGSVTFDTTIGKDGKVSGSRFVKKEGLNDDMVGCLTTAVKTMTFSPDRKSQVISFSFGTPPAGKGPSSPAAPVASFGGSDAGPPRH